MNQHAILIVEDDDALRDSMKELLELEGFVVRTAENGAEALALVENAEPPCLILLDLMMPVMDGWQFMHALGERQDAVLADVPIAVVSAAADVARARERFGCYALRKPVDANDLIELAQKYCVCAR